MNKKKLSYDELKNMLPDYCFGKLSDEKRADFEANVSVQPQLLAEIHKTKSSFASIDKNSLNNLLDEKTRNLSVSINEKLSKQKEVTGIKYLKYLVPVLSAAVLFIVVFKPFSADVVESANETQMISAAEVESMLDSVTNESDLLTAANNSGDSWDFADFNDLGILSDELANVYDEFALDDLLSHIDEMGESSDKLTISETNLYSIIENLNDNDVEQILEELNDAEILSQI